MADGTTLPGTGTVIATDEIGGVHHQRVKLSVGADGAAADCSSANPLPVVQQDPGDSTRQGSFDELFEVPVHQSVEHSEIHEKRMFMAHFADEAMNDNDTIHLAFKTPNTTKRLHMVAEFVTLVGGDLNVIEGPTWTTNTGSLCPVVNHFREAAPDSSVVLEDKTATPAFTATDNILSNVTGVSGGTSIQRRYAWGVKNRSGAGSLRGSLELVLAPDTQYVVTFTADGGSNKGQVILEWYEHTDA